MEKPPSTSRCIPIVSQIIQSSSRFNIGASIMRITEHDVVDAHDDDPDLEAEEPTETLIEEEGEGEESGGDDVKSGELDADGNEDGPEEDSTPEDAESDEGDAQSLADQGATPSPSEPAVSRDAAGDRIASTPSAPTVEVEEDGMEEDEGPPISAREQVRAEQEAAKREGRQPHFSADLLVRLNDESLGKTKYPDPKRTAGANATATIRKNGKLCKPTTVQTQQ